MCRAMNLSLLAILLTISFMFCPEPSFSWLHEHLGFLTDEQQMNVGLTRARRGLCIIGEMKFFFS